MRILIYGAGGIGSVMGAFLARSGHDVSLVGRTEHMKAIAKQGLKVSGIWGSFCTRAFEVYTGADAIAPEDRKFDLVLLTVKSYDTQAAVEKIAPYINEDATLVSFQNGLGNMEAILKKIKPSQYLAGRVIFGVETAPGEARITVTADAVAVGSMPGSEPKIRPEKIAEMLNEAGIACRAVPDIISVIWAKVIYNCALNGICALHEMPYGDILKNPETREWMREIVRECYAVGLKKGVALSPGTAEEYIALLEQKLIPSTAQHYPSMLQDLKKGKRLEIDALNGAIVRLGRELDLSNPANEKVYNRLISLKSA
jgi:2-dehydropantoate 2-reductase